MTLLSEVDLFNILCPFILTVQVSSTPLIYIIFVLLKSQLGSKGKITKHRTFCIITPRCSAKYKTM